MTQPIEFTTGAPDFNAAMAWRASQVEEYSSWVAASDIYVGRALAYVKGDPVPASNVITHNYDRDGLVERPAGWSDPVPGDNIEDAAPVAAAPSTVDQDQAEAEATAFQRTTPKKTR